MAAGVKGADCCAPAVPWRTATGVEVSGGNGVVTNDTIVGVGAGSWVGKATGVGGTRVGGITVAVGGTNVAVGVGWGGAAVATGRGVAVGTAAIV